MSYKFKKGDKVVSRHFGIGEVNSITGSVNYPIQVEFSGTFEVYTRQGHQYLDNDFNPITDDIIIPATKLSKYLYQIEVDIEKDNQ
jgi:hypothetical protein